MTMNATPEKVLDLFSGIGGFSLGLEKTGKFKTVAFCEIEDFPRKVLSKKWPGVHCYENIETARFDEIGPVDLVTAGFPCQDISFAGKGAGISGERSRLFWHIIRTALLVGRPKLLLENVAALLVRGMGTVLGALAQIGYNAEWNCIRADQMGLPHRRERVWIIANAQCEGRERPIADNCIFSCTKASLTFSCDKAAIEWLEMDIDKQGLREDYGLSVKSHRDRLKSLGNAVVPQIPEDIGYYLAGLK